MNSLLGEDVAILMRLTVHRTASRILSRTINAGLMTTLGTLQRIDARTRWRIRRIHLFLRDAHTVFRNSITSHAAHIGHLDQHRRRDFLRVCHATARQTVRHATYKQNELT